MAKLTTVTSGTNTKAQDSQTAQATVTLPDLDISALANTSDTHTTPDPSSPPSPMEDDSPLLGDELMIDAQATTPPKRSLPIQDITKSPIATTLAIALLSFGVIGGLAFVWWGISAAQNRSTIADDTTPLEDIIEDEKQKEIDQLNQELYEQRANVALKDLKAEEPETEPEDETETGEDSDGDRSTSHPVVATSPAPPPPRRSTSPPPPRRVTPTPVSNRSASSPSTPSQANYDSPSQWFELAALGQIGATDFDADALPPPPSTLTVEAEPVSTDTEGPVMPQPLGGWGDTGLAVVTVNGNNNTPWPSADLHNEEISQGEIGILDRQPITQPAPADPPPTSLEAPPPDTALLASAKSDPWKTAASAYSATPDSDTIVYNADDFWDVDEDWDEPGTMYVEPAPPTQGDGQEAIALSAETTDNAIAYVHDTASNNQAATEAVHTKASESWDIEVDPNEGWEDTAPQTTDIATQTPDSSWDVAVDPNEGWADTAPPETAEQTATVAIGTMAKAKVITPIIWDMEAPRATDGIFTIELTEAMEGLNGEIVLPEGTRLIGDVSHVTSVGHVYQSIVGIHLPNGQQIPVPVIDHEAETGAPITPLVVRGKKGEALIADAVERSDGNRNSLANDLLIGAVNGLADAADNALEPDTSVQVNQGFGGSTVESQSNVNDPQAAFARGFLESTAQRMEERLYEETEEILVFQVDAGEKVSVVVNGLMAFNIPAGGWQEQ